MGRFLLRGPELSTQSTFLIVWGVVVTVRITFNQCKDWVVEYLRDFSSVRSRPSPSAESAGAQPSASDPTACAQSKSCCPTTGQHTSPDNSKGNILSQFSSLAKKGQFL